MDKILIVDNDITSISSKTNSSLGFSMFSDFNRINTNDLDENMKTVVNELKKLPVFLQFFNSVKDFSTKYEVIIPDEIKSKIRSGEFSFVKKKNIEQFVASVRDLTTGKIVKNLSIEEVPNVDSYNNIIQSYSGVIKTQALADISKQLQFMEHKLIEIQKEFNTDRIGKLQAGYSLYLEAMQMRNIDYRNQTLLSAIRLLTEGRSQLIESSKERFTEIEKHSIGFWSSHFKELGSHDFKNKQEKLQKGFINELFYIQRASQVVLSVYHELGEKGALEQSIAPYFNFVRYLSNKDRINIINEWDTSEIEWKGYFEPIVESIMSIPSFAKLNIKQNVLLIKE